MPSEPTITLYDIPSTASEPWSPNTWKARIVLNYKRIPYKVTWVSYPDIVATIKELGGKPTETNPDGKPHYTLPAIVDTSSGTPVVVTDSLAIAEYLDEKYPERPVFPKGGKALQYIFEDHFSRNVAMNFWMLMLPPSCKVLDERGQAYFRETRERWYGQGHKLEEWVPEGSAREGAWKALEQSFDALAAILDKNGPNVDYVAGGTEPTRADMIIVSFIIWTKAVEPEEGWNKRMRHWSGGRWERLWKKSQEWNTTF